MEGPEKMRIVAETEMWLTLKCEKCGDEFCWPADDMSDGPNICRDCVIKNIIEAAENLIKRNRETSLLVAVNRLETALTEYHSRYKEVPDAKV
jgi:hypothetical protein